MRKFVTMLLVLLSAQVYAQSSIQLTPLHSTDVFYYPDSFKIPIDVTIKNVSSSQIVVHVKRIVNNIDLAQGQRSQFCFNGQCYSTSQDDNPVEKDLVMDPGQEATGLTGIIMDFLPWLVCSQTPGQVVLRVSNTNSASDFTDVTFDYTCALVSVDIQAAANALSNPYPNPANASALVDYNLPTGMEAADVTITDVMGKTIFTHSITDKKGTLEIPTTQFAAGIYYMNIVADNQILTSKRLMVQH